MKKEQENLSENSGMNLRKVWGWSLVVSPPILWILIATINGFNFSRNWLGSYYLDWFFGVMAIATMTVGILILLYFNKNKL